MLAELQKKHYRALNDWFQSPLGLSVAQEFTTDLHHFNDFLMGDILLQLGNCGDNPWLEHLRYSSKWIASPFLIDKPVQLQSSLSQLPLDRNSVDCVIAPLSLEPFGNNTNLIDEIDRILKPTGFIVILSINPWSLWGAALKLGLLPSFADKHVKMRSAFNLNRILLQRGYRQVSLSNFCYIPPINNKTIINKLAFLDEVGRMVWPFPSGFYCYIAQKFEMVSPSLLAKPITHAVPQEYKSPLQPALNNDLSL